MQKIIGVRRDKEKALYYFLENIDNLKLGDKVVVDFDDFQTVATVSKLGMMVDDEKATEMNNLLRRATESDLQKYEQLKAKAKNYLPEIKKKSLALGLMMKFISAEYSLDGTKILIIFSSEERVDFRQLLKELASMLKVRIELKQIGQRDEVKLCGAVGQCGQPCCCARFLNEFEHVTVKMAKIQGLSLAPSKINGICGRLMCCLAYETPFYEEQIQKMPKVGSEIKTPNGFGVVVFNDILRERVAVKRKADGDTFVVEDFSIEELKEQEEKNQKEETNEIEQKLQISVKVTENIVENGNFTEIFDEKIVSEVETIQEENKLADNVDEKMSNKEASSIQQDKNKYSSDSKSNGKNFGRRVSEQRNNHSRNYHNSKFNKKN